MREYCILLLNFCAFVSSQIWTAVDQYVDGVTQDIYEQDGYSFSRSNHRIVSSARNNGFYMFGGLINPKTFNSSYEDLTWFFNITSLDWILLSRLNVVHPKGRSSHVFIPNSNGSFALLHGGENTIVSAFNDLWILDLNSGLWSFVYDSKLSLAKSLEINSNCTVPQMQETRSISLWSGTLSQAEIDDAGIVEEQEYWWDQYPVTQISTGDYIYIIDNLYYILEFGTAQGVNRFPCKTVNVTSNPWPALKKHAGAFDPVRNLFYVYGGQNQTDRSQGNLVSFRITQRGSNYVAVQNIDYSNSSLLIHSHAMTNVLFTNSSSLLAVFGGFVDEYDSGQWIQYNLGNLYVLDPSSNRVFSGILTQIGGISPTYGASMEYNAFYRQIWISGGYFDPFTLAFVDINTRNATSWAWRTGAKAVIDQYYHDTCIIPVTNGAMLWTFGGFDYFEEATYEMATVVFWNTTNTTRPGTLIPVRSGSTSASAPIRQAPSSSVSRRSSSTTGKSSFNPLDFLDPSPTDDDQVYETNSDDTSIVDSPSSLPASPQSPGSPPPSSPPPSPRSFPLTTTSSTLEETSSANINFFSSLLLPENRDVLVVYVAGIIVALVLLIFACLCFRLARRRRQKTQNQYAPNQNGMQMGYQPQMQPINQNMFMPPQNGGYYQ